MSTAAQTEKQSKQKKLKAAKPAATSQLSGGVIAGATALPQVNLLPSSVRARRALQRVKVWLVISLGVVLIAALLGYVVAMMSASDAETELDGVRADTQRLLQEQAKYAEVPVVLAQIEAAKAAELIGMGDEVLWTGFVLEALGALPADASLTSISTMARTPLMEAPMPGDALTARALGTVMLTHRSATVLDISAWSEALAGVPGFADPLFSTATITEDDGDTFYEVVTTVQITEDALSGRFTGEEGQK